MLTEGRVIRNKTTLGLSFAQATKVPQKSIAATIKSQGIFLALVSVD
jgi:hypothetical protein